MPDEVIKELQFDYEGKRDRWNGYDPATYKKIIEQYERIEAERRAQKKKQVDELYKDPAQRRADKLARQEERQRKREERAARRAAGEEVESSDTDSDTDDDDDDEYEDLRDPGQLIQKRDENTRTTVRNLRIREDTAKYLRNLNVNSAYYDPKTRSMRENPYPNKDPSEVLYAGDNFIRQSGDVHKIRKMQMFVWEASQRSAEPGEIVIEANPSAAELMYKKYLENKEKIKEDKKQAILDKYGGVEHLEAPPQELLLNQSEHYVEYSEDGKVIKGQEKAIPKSKWPEDILENNHTEIWGSWYDRETGKWGYKCCHQTFRNAYCTGKVGIEAAQELKEKLLQRAAGGALSSSASSSSSAISTTSSVTVPLKRLADEEENEDRSSDTGDEELRRPAKKQKIEKEKRRRRKKGSSSSSSSSSDSEDSEVEKERARRAARKQAILEASRKAKAAQTSSSSSSAPDLASIRAGFSGQAPSAQEMEEYMRQKQRAEDPMAKFANIEDAVD